MYKNCDISTYDHRSAGKSLRQFIRVDKVRSTIAQHHSASSVFGRTQLPSQLRFQRCWNFICGAKLSLVNFIATLHHAPPKVFISKAIVRVVRYHLSAIDLAAGCRAVCAIARRIRWTSVSGSSRYPRIQGHLSLGLQFAIETVPIFLCDGAVRLVSKVQCLSFDDASSQK